MVLTPTASSDLNCILVNGDTIVVGAAQSYSKQIIGNKEVQVPKFVKVSKEREGQTLSQFMNNYAPITNVRKEFQEGETKFLAIKERKLKEQAYEQLMRLQADSILKEEKRLANAKREQQEEESRIAYEKKQIQDKIDAYANLVKTITTTPSEKALDELRTENVSNNGITQVYSYYYDKNGEKVWHGNRKVTYTAEHSIFNNYHGTMSVTANYRNGVVHGTVTYVNSMLQYKTNNKHADYGTQTFQIHNGYLTGTFNLRLNGYRITGTAKNCVLVEGKRFMVESIGRDCRPIIFESNTTFDNSEFVKLSSMMVDGTGKCWVYYDHGTAIKNPNGDGGLIMFKMPLIATLVTEGSGDGTDCYDDNGEVIECPD
jgi:DNA-binding protein H-NS